MARAWCPALARALHIRCKRGSYEGIYLGTNDIGVLLDSTTGTHIRHDYIADSRIGIFNRVSDNTVVEEVHLGSNDEGIRLEKSTGVDIDFNIIMDGLTGTILGRRKYRQCDILHIMFRNEVMDMNFAGGEGSVAGNVHGYNECPRLPSGVCLGRALPSGEILTGSKEHGESMNERSNYSRKTCRLKRSRRQKH